MAEKKGFFKKIYEGLTKTRENISESIGNVFKGFTKVDDELFDELEEALILADCGPAAALDIVEELRAKVKAEKLRESSEVSAALVEIIGNAVSNNADRELAYPAVILVIGVNGVGKTTSIGKLAKSLTDDKKKVVIAAADTFRAAAIDQLAIWAERASAALISQQEGADPAAVVYDACQAARARKADVLIVDTAGRLHNKTNLMKELAKIDRIITEQLPNTHRETFLVCDATTGQNALSQARTFKEISDITGIILTKLDGTAKGGIIIGITKELSIPVRYIGVGEKADDLMPFAPQTFAAAVFDINQQPPK